VSTYFTRIPIPMSGFASLVSAAAPACAPTKPRKAPRRMDRHTALKPNLRRAIEVTSRVVDHGVAALAARMTRSDFVGISKPQTQ
jgi:hypothetical protein